MNNIIRLTGTGGAARQSANTAATSRVIEPTTVNAEEVRRVLGCVGKKLAAAVTAPPANTNKDKAGTKRKKVSDKKKKEKEGGQKAKKSKSSEKQADSASTFSIPDEFIESQPEDQITMLLELTRTMKNVTRGAEENKRIDEIFSPQTLTQIGEPQYWSCWKTRKV